MEHLYRKNVGIVVFNDKRKVLMCARADKPDYQWQFPQGGIDEGEELINAARRELREETGIISVKLIAVMPHSLRYDFPEAVKKKFSKQGCGFVGQEQSWVLFYFEGNNNEIDFHTNPNEIEFKAYEWVNIFEAPKRVVEFKKKVYSDMVKYFSSLIYQNNEG